MRRIPDSGTLVMRGIAHWRRCGFDNTALLDDVVTLAPIDAAEFVGGQDNGAADSFAGLAFDRHCRLFHALPEKRRIEFLLWGRTNALAVHDDPPQPFDITGPESETSGATPSSKLPRFPLALACDDADYLYIADPGRKAGDPPALWLVDIWQHEVAKRVPLSASPLDVCFAGGKVYVLLGANASGAQSWFSLASCDPVRTLPWPEGVKNASRLDVIATEGEWPRGFVLLDAGTAKARVVCLDDTTIAQDVPHCTDFVILPEDPHFGWPFMFARRPGDDFVMYKLEERTFASREFWRAPNYDGRGVAVAPDGRVAYWTSRGLRHAARARTQYEARGTLFGFALDSNREQNEWGRITLEACIPDGTQVTVRCFTRDDLDYLDARPRTPPVPEKALAEIKRPEVTPLPSVAALDHSAAVPQTLFRDDHLPPLETPPDDAFALYETPVLAPPGRFLWVVFDLKGTRSKTPKLRLARVEFPGHGLLRQLPKTLWRDPHAMEFLRLYLTPLAAALDEWGGVAGTRHRLLDPRIARADALEWLGSLVGLAMDPCWPETARRNMLRNAVHLFRIRGTPTGLCEMIRILTSSQVLIVELFKLRSGGVVGNPEARISRSVLGTGFRVGGSIGATAPTALAGSTNAGADDYAHRFTVMVVAQLSDEQMRCVRRLIETHKPAHTMFDLCAVETGSRVGVGLHVGLASTIGRNSGFSRLTLGDSVLGKGYVLGRPELDLPRPPALAGQAHECKEGAPS